jgi:hypothetical protein
MEKERGGERVRKEIELEREREKRKREERINKREERERKVKERRENKKERREREKKNSKERREKRGVSPAPFSFRLSEIGSPPRSALTIPKLDGATSLGRSVSSPPPDR